MDHMCTSGMNLTQTFSNNVSFQVEMYLQCCVLGDKTWNATCLMFQSKIISGFYLVFVMNITAIWLVLTIAILNVHINTSPKKPAPWIRHLAFNILSKALCVEVPRTDHSVSNDAEALNEGLQSVQNEWVFLGRVLDRLCLYLFTIINVAAFVFLMSYCDTSTLPHPKTLLREKSEWSTYM